MNNEKEKFQKYFKEKISNMRNLHHKGNNQLFEITADKKYLLKRYSIVQKDNWNRGKTEFNALSYLWDQGFMDIPQPLNFYEEDNIGIYSFEKGRRLKQEEIKKEDILTAVDFLSRLHNLSLEDKKIFSLERTSCISVADYIQLIEKRIYNISEDFAGGQKAEDFWNNIVVTKAQEVKESILKQGIDLNKKLSIDEQVITPGDFGFHNILVNNGKYVFLDFEFCGRDDPVKQILDFLHHDQTREISLELKNLFLEQYKKKTFISEDFETRLRLVDNLIGMNWTLIYLNPLSKKYQEHMNFVGSFYNLNEIIQERLLKAEKKLNDLNFFKEGY